MHRIDSTYAEADKFGAGKDGFAEGDPGVTPATETTEDWQDGVQEELITPIEAMGITLVKNTRNQLFAALKTMFTSFSCALWTERANAKDFNLEGVDYDGSALWAAIGAADGADCYLVTSADGRAWAEVAPAVPRNLDMYCIAHDQSGLWVAGGDDDGAGAWMLTSANGVAWAEVNPPVAEATAAIYGVAHDGTSLWCAVGLTGGAANAYIITSADGAAWTQRVSPSVERLTAVEHNGSDLWCAVGYDDGVDSGIFTSADGITWAEIAPTVPVVVDLYGVGYGNGVWVAVGNNIGGYAYILTSDDAGVTWTRRTPEVLTDEALRDVKYINGVWVAVGDGGYILTSTDNGVTWIERKTPKVFNLKGVAYDDAGLVVAAGNADGADAYILNSIINPHY